jgi:sodium-dependent dicarboxylate transporter 2/3/5
MRHGLNHLRGPGERARQRLRNIIHGGVDPIAPALGTCLGASLAFMLPISTPSNAMVYGTGLVPLSAMIKLGILMDLLGFFVIQIGLWILVPLLGYGSA